MDEILEEINELYHYGVGHEDGGASGRYPWGSGEKPFKTCKSFYDRIHAMKKEGLTDKEIALTLGLVNEKKEPLSGAELSSLYTIAKDQKRMLEVDAAKKLSEKGYGATEIGRMMADEFNNGKPIGESTIRSYLTATSEANMRLASNTAKDLKKLVDKHGFIDVGAGSEVYLNNKIGITSSRLNKSLNILKMEGYEVYGLKIPQVTNPGRWTTMKVLCKPGTTYPEVYIARDTNKIKPVTDFASEMTNENSDNRGFVYPKAINPNRVLVKSAESGGIDKDGLAEIRPGVADRSLGSSRYAQVRILVDGGGGIKDYYIKGMAVYGDPKDFPPGVDIIVNTNKPQEKFDSKGPLAAGLKSVEDNLGKDPTNPFGAAIKENGGQTYYPDPNGEYINPITKERESLSLINKTREEKEWDEWAHKLPSQFLSKQPLALIKRQLNIAEEDKEQEFKEIMSLTNPIVKKKLLEEFASDCDSSAVHLHAAALPGQAYKVILPITSLADNEAYIPSLENGTKCALIRYPHAGIFEIPIVKVNNNNEEGRKYLSATAGDAVGINKNVAGQLSGADFDGDTVMVIPITKSTKVASMKPFDELKYFDTNDFGSEREIVVKNGKKYGYRNGHEYMQIQDKQKEMGVISNLITDMTLLGAKPDELVRAVKHSMVVIDSEKHVLDYKASELENGIKELKELYQSKGPGLKPGGATTLISQAKGQVIVPERNEGAKFAKENDNRVELFDDSDPKNPIYQDPKTGVIYTKNEVKSISFDPATGEKVYTPTNRVYYKAKVTLPNGKEKVVNVFTNKGQYYYKIKETGEVYLIDDPSIVKSYGATKTSTKMEETNDANTLVSIYKTPQEIAYADFANKLKALANQARMESYIIKEPKQDLEAKAKYKEERQSLEYKLSQAIANKPKERQAQLIAGSRVQAILKEHPELDTDHRNKVRQTELRKARALVGASRNPIDVTDKEWEAIQSGAIAATLLDNIIKNIDSDKLKQLAMPRENQELNDFKVRRMKNMAAAGYTTQEIAKYFGISPSTVSRQLKA